MKIYIVGPVASGKTTLAKKISQISGIAYTELDGIVHKKDKNNKKWGNIRRPEDEIEGLFSQIIDKKEWVIEDAGRDIFNGAMENADCIIHLEIKSNIRKVRIFTRYLKQKIGYEKCLYTPSLKMVKFLYEASNNYDMGKDDLKKRLNVYNDKRVILRKKKSVENYLKNLARIYKRKELI